MGVGSVHQGQLEAWLFLGAVGASVLAPPPKHL